MSSNEVRNTECVICKTVGEVSDRMSSSDIKHLNLPYRGDYIIQSICTECQRKYIHPEVTVKWNVDQE